MAPSAATPAPPGLAQPRLLQSFGQWLRQPGFLTATPILAFFLIGFIGPLIIVLGFSFLPQRSFGFHGEWTVENYVHILTESYYIPFMWSFGLAAATVTICLLVSYPVSYGLAKVFGRWAAPVMLLLVIPLFVSENVRLFGWYLLLLKGGGIFAGTVKALFGLDTGTLLYANGTTLMGMVYVYLPYTLFPTMLGLSLVPKDQIDAAGDLGANRWQVFREVELPIAMPGILIGSLLTFVLAVGAISEAKVLGGANIVVISHAIQHEFTYAQNWPLGSAISMFAIAITGILVIYIMRRLDLDRLLGRR